MKAPEELPWSEGDTLLRFRAERSAVAHEIFGPIPRDLDELAAAARERVPDADRRSALLDALRPQWSALDLPRPARDAITRLEDPRTRIVVAGQQPALWGGPLLLAIKALATIEIADRLTEVGVPAVPLFWIASEDHDAGELWGGQIVPEEGPAIDLESPFSGGRTMLGARDFERTAAERLGALAALFAGSQGTRWRDRLTRLAADGPTDEFQKLWVELFAPRGLLPVRPEWLRELQRPLVAAELSDPTHAAQVRAGIARLEAAGLTAPIGEPTDPPIFWVDAHAARHRCRREGDAIRIGGGNGDSRPTAELVAELAADPNRVSPDALFRPIVQDTLLEPAVSVLGPNELAYHLELGEVYRGRGLSRPVLLPRPRLRVLDPEDAARLERLGIDPAELSPTDSAVELVPSPDAERRQAELRTHGDALLEQVDRWAEDDRLDPALRRRSGRLARRWRQDLEKLTDALGRGAGGDVEAERRTVSDVLRRLFPDGREGERVLSLLGFLMRHDDAGLDAIAEALEFPDGGLGDGRMRLLVLPPVKETCPDAS